MATLTVKLLRPHDAQRMVLDQAKRFNILACGRRWGKSQLGVDRIIAPTLQGYPTAWFSPTFKMLMEAWRVLQETLAPIIETRNNAEMRLSLRGGGSVTAFSLDTEVQDTVRGRAFKRVVIDEAALVRNLRQTWENAIRPTLADFRGDAWFLSTPRGFNDFRVLFDRGADPEREDWASWQMPTSSNPYIDPSEIEAARAEMTEGAFNQEFLAEFVNWEGAVFRNVAECATAERKDAPEAGHEYVIGADWGRSVDYTVFCVIDVTARSMVDFDRSNRVDYVVQRGRLQALYEKWRPSRIIAEANSIGQPILEELVRAGLPITPFMTSNASKANIVENLALAFEQRNISILNDPVLQGELQAFQAEQLPGGMLRYSAPSGAHDDCVISLALAWSVIQPEPRNALYHISSDNLYSDQTRPVSLFSQGGHLGGRFLVVSLDESLTACVEVFDDGRTLWVEREYFANAWQKTEAELAATIVNGSEDWPGLGIDPRTWPAVILPDSALMLASELRKAGAWIIEAAESEDESCRLVAGMLAQGKMRIHERCVNLRREMRTRSWDELRTREGKKRADPLRQFAATHLSSWRLSS